MVLLDVSTLASRLTFDVLHSCVNFVVFHIIVAFYICVYISYSGLSGLGTGLSKAGQYFFVACAKGRDRKGPRLNLVLQSNKIHWTRKFKS